MTDQTQEIGSLLGDGAEFSGKLTFLGTVRVEGKFEGEIFSEDTLVVAEGANIRGTIDVGTLIITGGTVDATVHAQKVVELHPSGILRGEIHTPALQIEKGAVFQGNCVMTVPPSEE